MSIDPALLFRLATNVGFERAVRSTARGDNLAWRAASRYVAGSTFDDAARTARRLRGQGVASSIDCFGERVNDSATARRVGEHYVQQATELAGISEDAWLAIDLSHLGLDIDRPGCADRLAAIARALPDGRRIQVGAEDASRADAVMACVLDVADRGLADKLGATMQANLHRTPGDLERLIPTGVHIRLVKGAFLEPAEYALPYGEATDIAYLRLAHRLATAETPFALATHDGVVREALLSALGPVAVEQLLGVRENVLDDLTGRDVPVRVYVPYGRDWFRYWMRRLAESRGS